MNLELAALHAPSQPPTEGSGQPPAKDKATSSGLMPEVVSELAEPHSVGTEAQEVVRWAHRRFGRDVILSSSFGADSALMLHLVSQIIPNIRVVFIDTGYLFKETYLFAEELQKKLGFELIVYTPQMTPARQEALYGKLWEQGEEGVRKYLQLNKIEPMQRALSELGVKAWIAGLRSTQTEHRQNLNKVGLQDGRIKIHPILDWSRERVDEYLKEHDLPRHPLYEQGYRSIGDWHSTIPVAPDQDERAGRFLGAQKECGLHLSAEANTSLSSSHL